MALTPLAAHRERVLALGPITGAIDCAALDALGLRLVDDVVSAVDLPGFASSALDGYAVRVADVPGELQVVGEVMAGVVPAAVVGQRTAVKIMTGGLLPEGAEAVVGVEVAERLEGDRVLIGTPTTAGAALRSAAGDVAAGQRILQAGQRIGPAQLAALLSAGQDRVRVLRRPRVCVISTGDELVPPGTRPGPAQLVDSNRPALLAAVAAAGAEAVDGGHCGDSSEELLERLAAHRVDLLITSGGISMGDRDVVKATLRDRGVNFDRVAMQPGMPQAWGLVDLPAGPVPFLGLPGNPVSALVSFTVFVRPLLGAPAAVQRRRLAEAVAGSPSGKVQFLRARLQGADAVQAATTSGSHLLAALAAADALVVVPEEVTDLPAGATVDVLPLEATWS